MNVTNPCQILNEMSSPLRHHCRQPYPAIENDHVSRLVELVLPAVLLGKGRIRPALVAPVPAATPSAPRRERVVLRMWAARLLVQVAEGGMFAFLLYWLRSIAPGYPENGAANIFSLVLAGAVPLSLMLGRWSDRRSRPVEPLVAAALLCACGMLVMAAAQTLA